MELTVALYARVSSQRQADEMTIRSQVAALRERMEIEKATLKDELVFLDEGYSGSSLQRPALERLRDLAHCGGLDRLYVHSPDRLARKYAYQVLLLEELKKHGVEVIFLNHDPQNQSPEGDLLLQMQGMIAEYERAKILERTRRGRRFAAQQGKVSVLGHAPYGYRYVPKREGGGEARLDVVFDEARVIQEMFTWVGVEGVSLSTVAARLNERGVPTATGKSRWAATTIHGILLRSAYTGTAKYPKTRLFPREPGRRPKRGDPRMPRQEKVARPASPTEQVPIAVPAIISQELFDVVAQQLVENRRRQREQKQGAEHLLGGLTVCHVCGSAYCARRMHRRKDGTRYTYYHCLGTDGYRHDGQAICTNRGVLGPQLEKSVWSDVCALLKDPARLRRELQRRLDRPPTGDRETIQWEQAISQLKRRIARLIDAYENGLVEKSDFEARIRPVRERLSREEQALATHRREVVSEEELR
jgi:site-specific DNA recombinase